MNPCHLPPRNLQPIESVFSRPVDAAFALRDDPFHALDGFKKQAYPGFDRPPLSQGNGNWDSACLNGPAKRAYVR
jgi:hypothetical protein